MIDKKKLKALGSQILQITAQIDRDIAKAEDEEKKVRVVKKKKLIKKK